MNEPLEVLRIILEVAGIVLVVVEIVERVAQVVRWVQGRASSRHRRNG